MRARQRGWPRAAAVLSWLQLAALITAVSAKCIYPDLKASHVARALLQQQPLNNSLVALTPAVPVLANVEALPMPVRPPQPAVDTTPQPQPPIAAELTARVGQVELAAETGVASATTIVAQQGFWRRGNLIYANRVYLTQNSSARDIPGYKTAFVARGEDLTVYAADIITDDLKLPGRNVSIVTRKIGCANKNARACAATRCRPDSFQAVKGDVASTDPQACSSVGKYLVPVEEARRLLNVLKRPDSGLTVYFIYRLAPHGGLSTHKPRRNFEIYDNVPQNTGDSLCCSKQVACDCTIDVSGLPGASQTGQAAAGRNAGDNGFNGTNGGDGGPGGSITLRTPATTGILRSEPSRLVLKAGGGQGGYGQQGGDGATGAAGSPGLSTCSRDWFDAANREIVQTTYCENRPDMTIDTRGYRGESGRNASDGGNGGNNGFNGKGGAGGKITVVSRDPLPGDTLLTDVAGGPGGKRSDLKRGRGGNGGTGGKGGPGARYVIDSRAFSDEIICSPGPEQCCCYKSDYIQCDGVTCEPLYDSGWIGRNGFFGNRGSFGTIWGQASSGTPGSTSLTTKTSQPGVVPAAAMRLWLLQVKVAWLNNDQQVVTDLLGLLSSVSPCNENPTDCADIASTISVLVAQLNSGLDYYGNRPNFVPSVSLGTIQAYTCNALLPLMKTLEDSIKEYEKASGDASARKTAAAAAIQDMQSKLKSMKDSLADEMTVRGELESQKELLRGQRDNLRSRLITVIGVFEQAINDKKQEEASNGNDWDEIIQGFGNFINLGASIYKVTKGDLDGVGESIDAGTAIYNQWEKSLEPPPERLNIDVLAVAKSVTQLRDTYNEWGKFNETAFRERRKQAMVKEKWEKLIANYTTLPVAEEYQVALAAYDDACGAYNQLLLAIDSKILAIIQAQKSITALEAQLPNLQNNLDQLFAQDEPWVAQFLYRTYEMAQSGVLRNLYMQLASSNFIYGKADKFSVQDTSYNGLLAKSAQLQEDLFKQLQSTSPSTPTTFVRILLNNRTVPGFDEGMNRRQLDFTISACVPAFFAYTNVFVREFRVKFVGATAKPGPESNAALTARISTPGTSVVRAAGNQLMLNSYVMQPRISSFFYYLNENPWTKRNPGYFVSEDVPPTAQCAPLGDKKSIYSPLSPLAQWSLFFPNTGTNDDVDFSKVTEVQIEFRGSTVTAPASADKTLREYCATRGFTMASSNSTKSIVTAVSFVGSRKCPAEAQLVDANLNQGVLQGRPVYLCVTNMPAAFAADRVNDILLVYGNATVPRPRCPSGYARAGVDLNLGVADAPITPCTKTGPPASKGLSEFRVVYKKADCNDGNLVGNANTGTTGTPIYLCEVPAMPAAELLG